MSERVYEIDGLKLPSVTTILGILQKPALVPWAAKETVASFNDQLHDSFYYPEECKFIIPDTAWPNIMETAKKAHRVKKTEAAAHGTKVHDAIQAWIESNGTLDPCTFDDERVRSGLEAFLAWGEKHKLEIISWEEVVSLEFYYAGRYDLYCKIDGIPTLIDFKTSSGIWEEYWYQLGAYAYALNKGVSQVGVLRIDKETGEFEFQTRVNWIPYYDVFINLCRAYHSIKHIKEISK